MEWGVIVLLGIAAIVANALGGGNALGATLIVILLVASAALAEVRR